MPISKVVVSAMLMAAVLNPGIVTAQGSAQPAYPSRTVTMVVPFTSGGPNDSEFRLFQPRLQESTKQSFVFDFKPGATSAIGVGYVAKAAPDGYTLLLTNGSMTIHPNFYPDLPYDVAKSFDPVIQLTERYTVLMASTASLPNVHSLADLVAYGKANPGKLNCGDAGAGGITHIACVSLSTAIGIPFTAVHYKGVSQGVVPPVVEG